jgi:hypothetical protein
MEEFMPLIRTAQLVQTYESSISDALGNWGFSYIVIPRRSLEIHPLSTDPADVCVELDLNSVQSHYEVGLSDLPIAIAAILLAQKTGMSAIEIYDGPSSLEPPLIDEYYRALAFAQGAAYSDVIPFEQSPLEATSLASTLIKGGGTGVGAFIGWVLAGPTPLLLITVPAGMILCGAASGVAAGLQQGLRERISLWLTGHGTKATGKTRNAHTGSSQKAKEEKPRTKEEKPRMSSQS